MFITPVRFYDVLLFVDNHNYGGLVARADTSIKPGKAIEAKRDVCMGVGVGLHEELHTYQIRSRGLLLGDQR